MKNLFFKYCSESGLEFHETLEDALADASNAVQNYLDEDGWREEVTVVCVGEITHRAKMCDQVFPDGEIDEDGIDEAGDYWNTDWEYKCNYKMLPVEQSPAPDVAELLEALTPQVLDWMRCGLAANGHLRDGDHPSLAKLRAAIDACRKQGGGQ